MRELLRPFGRFHVLGIALLGCVAFAFATGQGAWMWVGLVGAVIVSLWAGVLLLRDLRAVPDNGAARPPGNSSGHR